MVRLQPLFQCKVVEKVLLTEDTFLLKIENPIKNEIKPGQFAMIKPAGACESNFFLPRPFSIAGCGESIDFIIKVVGRGTRILSKAIKGDTILCLYPLGRGFPEKIAGRKKLIVAGGVGIAPVLFLLRYEVEKLRQHRSQLIYGASSSNQLVMLKELKELSSLTTVTEDGSTGTKATAYDAFRQCMDKTHHETVVVCGPAGLIRKVASYCIENDIDCWTTLEATMGCGFGACLGCAVETSNGGYLQVCRDGPVFNARQIKWEKY